MKTVLIYGCHYCEALARKPEHYVSATGKVFIFCSAYCVRDWLIDRDIHPDRSKFLRVQIVDDTGDDETYISGWEIAAGMVDPASVTSPPDLLRSKQ